MNQQSESYFDIIDWASSIVNFDQSNDIEIIVETPWSTVIRIKAAQSTVYLKQTSPKLFIEAKVISAYRKICDITCIPNVISENENLSCFLMSSCGDVSLRTYFNGHLDVDVLIKGIEIYKEMQKSTLKHLDTFIKLGVPDWSISNLSDMYEKLVNDRVFLQSEGLSEAEIDTLCTYQGHYKSICSELASYGIAETLNHGDFHDNNIIIDQSTKKISIIDLGEITIDHPFLSLKSCLDRMAWRYKISPDSLDYKRLYDACFDSHQYSKKDLSHILSLIQKLLPSYAVFSHMRLIDATGTSIRNVERMNGRIKNGLLNLIEQLSK